MAVNSAQKPADKVFKALGHPARLNIVRELSDGERCVHDLVDSAELGWSTVSRHLSILLKAGIISNNKHGLQVFYRIKLPCVMKFIECLDNRVAVK